MDFFLRKLIMLVLVLNACSHSSVKNSGLPVQPPDLSIREAEIKPFSEIDSSGKTIEQRFPGPEGFFRIKVPDNSFAGYLRALPLKPHGSAVLKYDGSVKPNHQIYSAVVDLPIGNKDLHQCADAVMRLRAEYLYEQGWFDSIHFNLTNGFRVDYSEWRKGKRVAVQGNKTWWELKTGPSDSWQDFWKYMEFIFTYAGTLSLSNEMIPVKAGDMQIGDVFIRGGSPGHAVVVVDVAEHPASGEKIFLLAQSYMPAQELHVLQNPENGSLSPWYLWKGNSELRTPEWTFQWDELRRFK